MLSDKVPIHLKIGTGRLAVTVVNGQRKKKKKNKKQTARIIIRKTDTSFGIEKKRKNKRRRIISIIFPDPVVAVRLADKIYASP